MLALRRLRGFGGLRRLGQADLRACPGGRPRRSRRASSASSAGAISRRAATPVRSAPRTVTTSALSSRPFVHDLDLLGTRRLHPGAAPLLDPPANPHAPPGQRLRLETRGRKRALIALGDGDGEVLRPAPPEIHIDGAAALAHRQHLALDQREPAAALEDLRGVLGLVHDIIRFGPQAKLGGPRRLLVAEQLPRAGRVADPRRNPRVPRAARVPPATSAPPVLADENMGHEAAVAIGLARRRGASARCRAPARARIRRGIRIFGSSMPGEADDAAILERDRRPRVAARTVAVPMVTKRQSSCARAGVRNGDRRERERRTMKLPDSGHARPQRVTPRRSEPPQCGRTAARTTLHVAPAQLACDCETFSFRQRQPSEPARTGRACWRSHA